MNYKTKEAARKAAHAEMGAEAIEGVDFIVKGKSDGWTFEQVPAANDGATQAQAVRFSVIRASAPGKVEQLTETELKHAGLVSVNDVGGHAVWTEADNPLVVDGTLYPNKTRATEARRLAKERQERADSPTPLGDAADTAKKSVANKRAARKDAATPPAKAPKKAAAPKAKKAPQAKPSAPEGSSKTDMIIGMLSTSGGATSKELEAATGWMPHSVRGLLGTLRKKGVNVVSKKLPGEPTIYRIQKGKAAAPPPAAEPMGDVI